MCEDLDDRCGVDWSAESCLDPTVGPGMFATCPETCGKRLKNNVFQVLATHRNFTIR